MIDIQTLGPALTSAILGAVDPRAAVLRHISREGNALIVDGRGCALGADVRLVALGKAAAPMASAVAECLGRGGLRGVIATKLGHAAGIGDWPGVVVIEAGHPVPDANSLRAGDAVCEALMNCAPDTLVIACISGGASALVAAPHAGISLGALQAINQALLAGGADIREINAVRSRLDRLKGGGLARLAQPGRVVGLILSDVIGDPIPVIASGMTDDPAALNVLVGNNTQACAAAELALRERGYAVRIVTTELRGEAREQGAAIARAIAAAPAGSALIYGGEPTVTLRGSGLGGRNQELALAAAIEFERLGAAAGGCGLMSFATDGTDGPTDAGGAICDAGTVAQGAAAGLDAADFLQRNDSYRYFTGIGGLIMTGPTGTNVADVVVAVKAA